MSDCVIAADGYSYERAAIISWLTSSNHSPVTGEELPNKRLSLNINLKIAICTYAEKLFLLSQES